MNIRVIRTVYHQDRSLMTITSEGEDDLRVAMASPRQSVPYVAHSHYASLYASFHGWSHGESFKGTNHVGSRSSYYYHFIRVPE